MKKILLALSIFAFVTTHAQTADEVVQKYTNAHGGLDAFNKVKTAKMTGTLTTQGMELPVISQIINGRAVRTDVQVEAANTSVITSIIDGKGWKQNQFAGTPDPTDVEGTELTELKAQTMMASGLMDYKNRGHKIELLGQEDVNGKKAFKIKLTNKDDGKQTTYFIDATNYTLLKSVTTREIQGESKDIESTYADIKEIGGLKFYMTRSQFLDGEELQTLNYSSIELNVPIDEKIFAKP